MNIDDKISEYMKKDKSLINMSYKEVTSTINKKFKTKLSVPAIQSRWKRRGLPAKNGNFKQKDVPVHEQIENDIQKADYKDAKKVIENKYHTVLDRALRAEKERDAFKAVKESTKDSLVIKPKYGVSKGEATAVVLASDWHIEENVRSESVNGKNFHNVEIASRRSVEFFENVITLVKKEQNAVTIETLVLALLGDFISGNIHEELLENCDLTPIMATIKVKNLIVAGIEAILRETKLKLVIPCHVGNHTRITKKIHISNEQGNNMEYFMYHTLMDYFKDEKRIQWIIAEGYHSYLKIYDWTIRLHHGHAIKFGGGIGGLTIPVQKSISQWNKIKWADFDCFGHFHTQMDGKNFLSNGCNIGYNAYAVSIKADFDTPRQTFFLIDKKRGKTVVAPIVYSI
ncbi:MAG: hypothetical protein WC069_05860 [Candidatus Shapirobacteria bacterium]